MQRPRVLVVEDDKLIQRLLEMMLDSTASEVLLASHGDSALRQVKEARPDLVILDISLGGMSGIEVCQAIKSSPETQDTKVIFLSAHVGREREARAAGGDAFLSKPFSPLQLVHIVETLIDAASRTRNSAVLA